MNQPAETAPPASQTGPRLLLLLQMLIVGGVLWSTGRFHAVEVPDTVGYVDFPFQSLTVVLSHYRTPGYPLFLELVRLLTGDLQLVPVVQFLVYCGGVALFFWSLGSIAGRWSRAVIAGSLLYTNILFNHVGTISTETVTATLGILSCALVIRRGTLRVPPRFGGALLIGLAVTAAWWTRPGYLFLIGLIPVLGAMLAAAYRESPAARSWKRELLVLGLATFLPLLAYCGLRAKVASRFGIVSFGGYNLIGVSGQFLDDDVVADLPADLQPLAREALQRRSGFSFSGPDLPHSERLNYDRMEWRYDDTIWRIFTPVAKDTYGEHNPQLNSELKRLAGEIIKARPRDYLIWLAKAVRQGTRKLVSDFVLNPVYLAAIFLTILLQIAITITYRPLPLGGPQSGQPNTVATLFMVGVMYAAASLTVVIMVCPPLGRMTDAASVHLGPALAAALCDRVGRLRASRQ